MSEGRNLAIYPCSKIRVEIVLTYVPSCLHPGVGEKIGHVPFLGLPHTVGQTAVTVSEKEGFVSFEHYVRNE